MHIVVDGLDEIDARDREGAPSANPLRLPPSLPDGVYVAYSARLRDAEKSGYVTLDKVPIHDRHVSLESGEAEDLRKAAVRRYVQRICQRQDYIQKHIAQQPQELDEDAFVNMFCDKSDWNFMISRCCLFESNAWKTDNPLDWLAPDLMRYYDLHLIRMAKRSYYGVDGRATFCFGLGNELSRKNLIRLAAGDDRRSRAEALRALDEWIGQGLIISRRSSPSSNTDWLLPYHRTYREFLADKFRELDDVIFLESFIDNLTGDDVRFTMRRVHGDVYLEWVSLLLRLCRWLGDPSRFEAVVSSLELWQETLRRHRGLETMLDAIGQISPPPECRADFERLFQSLAGHLIEWSIDKQLPIPDSEDHYDLSHILESLSRPQFYQTRGNLTLLDQVDHMMEQLQVPDQKAKILALLGRAKGQRRERLYDDTLATLATVVALLDAEGLTGKGSMLWRAKYEQGYTAMLSGDYELAGMRMKESADAADAVDDQLRRWFAEMMFVRVRYFGALEAPESALEQYVRLEEEYSLISLPENHPDLDFRADCEMNLYAFLGDTGFETSDPKAHSWLEKARLNPRIAPSIRTNMPVELLDMRWRVRQVMIEGDHERAFEMFRSFLHVPEIERGDADAGRQKLYDFCRDWKMEMAREYRDFGLTALHSDLSGEKNRQLARAIWGHGLTLGTTEANLKFHNDIRELLDMH